MGLCTTNRLEGGTFTLYFQGTLTTCFEDTFLLPLFTWILILVLLALFAFARQKAFRISPDSYNSFDSPLGTPAHRKLGGGGTGRIKLANLGLAENGEVIPTSTKIKAKLGLGGTRMGGGKKKLSTTGPVKRRRIALGCMLFFLFVNIAVQTLIIARLSVSGRGVGLLPFLYIPLLLSGLSLFLRPHSYPITIISCVYFIVLAIVTGVKTRSLSVFQHAGFNLTVDQLKSYASYGYSDEILDNGVMAGIYGILMVLEIGLAFLDRRTK
ncbi:hypothetical protein BDY24DRAFT_393114 [Mrakia frigida]|uniref:uncharacterized protein n=1 Tax=Mrakia frigida TaxID=29902 RepID=UPI003FCC0F68